MTRPACVAGCIVTLAVAAACGAGADPVANDAAGRDLAAIVDRAASTEAVTRSTDPTATTAVGGAPTVTTRPTSTAPTVVAITTTTHAGPVTTGVGPPVTARPTGTTAAPDTVPSPPMTACMDVAHIGDSTGVHLWDAEYVGGDPANTLEARYRGVGVEGILHDDDGGRAIVERLAIGREHAVEVAQRIRASGFRGCWVIMVGTNDAANLAAGASVDAAERIGRMLDVIDGDPVLWVDAMTLRAGTAYSADAMLAWNAVLGQFDAELDHLAVADWSARAQPGWFQPDGIHLTTEGRIWRAAITALELAEAFPAR